MTVLPCFASFLDELDDIVATRRHAQRNHDLRIGHPNQYPHIAARAVGTFNLPVELGTPIQFIGRYFT